MGTLLYKNMRWLSLIEIAVAWHKTLPMRQESLLRELQLGVINFERIEKGLPWVKRLPAETELPSPETTVDRAWLENFCNKQEWERPSFWFASEAPEPREPGRPEYPHYEEMGIELLRRIAEAQASRHMTREASYLRKWATATFPNDPAPKEKSIRNRLGSLFASPKS